MLSHLTVIGRNALIYGLGQGGGRLLGLVTLPIFTAHLSAAEFGTIAILTLVGLGLRTCFSLGVGPATGIVYFRHRDPTHRGSTIWTASTLQSIAGLSIVVALLVSGRWLAGALFGESEPWFVLPMQGVAVALQLASEPIQLGLQFEGRASQFIAVSLIGTVMGLAVSFGLVVWLSWGVTGWVIGNLLGAGTSGLAALILSAGHLPRRIERSVAWQLLRYGYPFVPGALFIFVLLSSAPYFIKLEAGVGEAGIFAVGYQLGMGITLATGAFTTAWYPFFQSYALRPREGSLIFPRMVTAYALGFGLLTLVFFVLARPAILVLTAPPFHAAYSVVGPIAAAQCGLALWSALLPGVYFARETAVIPLVQGPAAATAGIAHLVLIPRMGVQGAGLAILAGVSALVLLQLIVNRWRRYEVAMLEPRRLAASIAVTALACGAQRFIDERLAISWALILSGGLLLLAVTAMWLLLTSSERHAVLGQILRQRRRRS